MNSFIKIAQTNGRHLISEMELFSILKASHVGSVSENLVLNSHFIYWLSIYFFILALDPVTYVWLLFLKTNAAKTASEFDDKYISNERLPLLLPSWWRIVVHLELKSTALWSARMWLIDLYLSHCVAKWDHYLLIFVQNFKGERINQIETCVHIHLVRDEILPDLCSC